MPGRLYVRGAKPRFLNRGKKRRSVLTLKIPRASARGIEWVYFCPKAEDYGFITAEAFASRKAVITAGDSGGPTELVRDGESGFVVSPTPKEIAAKIDLLAETSGLAEKLGVRGYETVRRMTWPDTVRKLLLISS